MNKTFYKLYIRKDIRHYFDMDTSIKSDIQVVNFTNMIDTVNVD